MLDTDVCVLHVYMTYESRLQLLVVVVKFHSSSLALKLVYKLLSSKVLGNFVLWYAYSIVIKN